MTNRSNDRNDRKLTPHPPRAEGTTSRYSDLDVWLSYRVETSMVPAREMYMQDAGVGPYRCLRSLRCQ